MKQRSSPFRSRFNDRLLSTLVVSGLLFLFICCRKASSKPPVDPPPQGGDSNVAVSSFHVTGSRIVDSAGNDFVSRGINVDGPLWPWTRATVPDADLIASTWKFNTVRVNCWPQNPPFQHPDNADLDAIVSAFTSRHIVVMIEDHSFTGTYPTAAQLATSVTWWTNLAVKYKNQGLVWFNLMNEPGGGGNAPPEWKMDHETLIRAIRGAGAMNVIVCDEHAFGQANGFDKTSSSAALTFGPALTALYPNLVFSLHLYGNWIYGQERLGRYVTAAKQNKLALIFGEYGAGSDISAEVASAMFSVALPENIGRIGWHWVGQDQFKITTGPGGGGFAIDDVSGKKPGNLGFGGNLLWEDNHLDLTAASASLIPPPVLISNVNFDAPDNSPVSGSKDIFGWINFGSAQLDGSPANRQQGSFSLHIPGGAAGGCGQDIYLEPGRSYRLTAWGKNSAAPSSASAVGIDYTAEDASAETAAATLLFPDTGSAEITATFSVPSALSHARIYIYKNDPATDFWVDNIRVVPL